MRLPAFALPLVLAASFLFAQPATAALLINVDKSAQRMSVRLDGVEKHNWPVSTGRAGHATPQGVFTPFRLEEDHYSKEWDDAPMPHSVFFTKQGHAIHGSLQTKQLGSPASAGCVRLAPPNAAALFALVKEAGLNNTKVVISGTEPTAAPLVAGRSRAPSEDQASITPADPSGTRVYGGEPVEAYTARMRQRYYEERAAAEAQIRGGHYYQQSPYEPPPYQGRYAPQARVYGVQPYPPPAYEGRYYPYVRRYGW